MKRFAGIVAPVAMVPVALAPVVMILVAMAIASLASVSVARAAAPDGKALFASNCSDCHQATGVGVPGVFPALAGRVGAIAAHPEGRAYLVHVLADGLTGPITVSGQPIAGYMPAFPQLDAPETAAVLTYVASLGGSAPVTVSADDVTAARKTALSASDVHAERARLVTAGTIAP